MNPYTKIFAETNSNCIRMLHCYAENNKVCNALCLIKIREWNMCEGPVLLSVTLLT